MIVQEFSDFEALRIIGRERVEKLIKDRSLNPFDLVDTGKAVEIGHLLQADYIFTGTIVGMPTSVVIFGRILNVRTGEIEATEQVNLPVNDELQILLGG